MHEMSLCESILQILEAAATEQGFERVTTVHLAIGALACVDIDSMRFSFGAVCEGSVAGEARLQIETIPAIGVCPDCGRQVAMEQRYDPCSSCGAFGLRLLQGDEMKVTQLEVE